MANEFLLVTQFLTVAVMLALAGWLMVLKFSSPVNRSFAAFLVLRAMQTLFALFSRFASNEPAQESWRILSVYMQLLVPFAMLYFLMIYLRPRGDLWWRIILLGTAAGSFIIFFLDHCSVRCVTDSGLTKYGPMSLVILGAPVVAGLVGMAIAFAIRFGRAYTHANASALVAASFALTAIFNAMLAISGLLRLGWVPEAPNFVSNVWLSWAWWGYGLAMIPGAIAAAILVSVYRGRGELSTRGAVFLVALAFSVLSAMFVGLTGPSISEEWSLFIVGVWQLIPPAFIAFALLRHRVIGIDHHVKLVVRSTAIATFFGAAFFVGSELLESLVDLPGLLLGLAAAGLITIGLKPIQKWAQQFADKAFPHTRPVMELTSEQREEMFLEQATLVWADGVVGAKERTLLDRLQSRLEITKAQAKKLEKRAQQAFQMAS